MNNDVTATSVDTTDETEGTEVKFTITPKQKLIAKIAGTVTAVAGILVLGYKLGSDGAFDDVPDALDAAVDELTDDTND